MENILLRKPVSANSFYAPYTPEKAVNGTYSYSDRWVGTTMPAWLQIDLQGYYWVNRWKAYFMGYVTWDNVYNMKDCSFLGSIDGMTWHNLNDVLGNVNNYIDNTFTPKLVRYVRFITATGHRNNNQLASLCDIEAYDPANAPFLSRLRTNMGDLISFSKRELFYSIRVKNTVGSIVFQPTALKDDMLISVNGEHVKSGAMSAPFVLQYGSNQAVITVSSRNPDMNTQYLINIFKEAEPATLRTLVVKNNRNMEVQLTPDFTGSVTSYTANVLASTSYIYLIPILGESDGVTIKVNSKVVESGKVTDNIPMEKGVNTVVIEVLKEGASTTVYTLSFTKPT
jgi:hypothetical protein